MDPKTTRHRQNTLTLVRTYVDKEEFDRALSLLEGLLIDNPDDSESSKLLDVVLAAKKAKESLAAGEQGRRSRQTFKPRLTRRAVWQLKCRTPHPASNPPRATVSQTELLLSVTELDG